MPNHFIKEIISGGQTGVDRAALDASLEFNIPHSGWCPHGRKAEDGIIPAKYNLKEAPAPTFNERLDPDAIYKKRTELNAKDSDGTLIILQDEPIGGTLYTIQMAEKHKKPYLIFKLSDNFQIEDILNWVIKNNIHRLNVAGPRASQAPDIYNAARIVLHRILSHGFLNTEKIHIDLEKLYTSGDRNASLILRLMLACNDISLANHFSGRVSEEKWATAQEHVRFGARMYFVRLQAGHLSEAINLIRELMHDLEKNQGLQLAYDKCLPENKADFKKLRDCLKGGNTYKDFKENVYMLRNKIAFHYDEGNLFKKAVSDRKKRGNGRYSSITVSDNIRYLRFNIADEIIDTIVCRLLWKIDNNSNLQNEADKRSTFCFKMCVAFLNFCSEFVFWYIKENAERQ